MNDQSFPLTAPNGGSCLVRAPVITAAPIVRHDLRKRRRVRRLRYRLVVWLLAISRERYSGKRRTRRLTGKFDNGRCQVAETYRVLDDLPCLTSPWWNDDERNVQLRVVKTHAVAERSGVFTEAFAVVGGNDHPRLFEHPLSVQDVHQLPKLLIQVGDAIVVRSRRERDTAW